MIVMQQQPRAAALLLLALAAVPAAALKGASVDYIQGHLDQGEDSKPEQSSDEWLEHWQQMHHGEYLKEFMVDIDVFFAHDQGASVGVNLDFEDDFEPVSVRSVHKAGLLEAWNRAYPDKAVLVGDEIVKVNDIVWHHNSHAFAQSIKEQVAGAKSILSLSIQRPRQKRFKEFVAEVDYTDVLRRMHSGPTDPIMGWKLNSTIDWDPVFVEKIRISGLVAKHNREHPESRILPGDEILQVDDIKWQHGARTFEEHLRSHFSKLGQKTELLEAPKNVLAIHIRRPSRVQEVPDTQVYTRQFPVELNLTDTYLMGWTLNATSEAEPPAVTKVKEDTPLSRFNEANPARAVQVGDGLIRMNKVVFRNSSRKFLEGIGKEIYFMRRRSGQPGASWPLTLLMERRLVQPISKEWTVTLPAAEGKTLGWELASQCDEFPLIVDKVHRAGVVAEWNQDNVDYIQKGDVIAKVNGLPWQRNSTEFERRLNEQYSQSQSQSSGTITLFLRRPVEAKASREAETRPSEKDFLVELPQLRHSPVVAKASVEAEMRPFQKEFLAELPLANGQPVGWQLQSDDATAPLSVEKVRRIGAVGAWNAAHPAYEIVAGDQIGSVNGVLWQGNSTRLADHLYSLVDAARRGTGTPTITVSVQRPWPSVRDMGGTPPLRAEDNSSEDSKVDVVAE